MNLSFENNERYMHPSSKILIIGLYISLTFILWSNGVSMINFTNHHYTTRITRVDCVVTILILKPQLQII